MMHTHAGVHTMTHIHAAVRTMTCVDTRLKIQPIHTHARQSGAYHYTRACAMHCPQPPRKRRDRPPAHAHTCMQVMCVPPYVCMRHALPTAPSQVRERPPAHAHACMHGMACAYHDTRACATHRPQLLRKRWKRRLQLLLLPALLQVGLVVEVGRAA